MNRSRDFKQRYFDQEKRSRLASVDDESEEKYKPSIPLKMARKMNFIEDSDDGTTHFP